MHITQKEVLLYVDSLYIVLVNKIITFHFFTENLQKTHTHSTKTNKQTNNKNKKDK